MSWTGDSTAAPTAAVAIQRAKVEMMADLKSIVSIGVLILSLFVV